MPQKETTDVSPPQPGVRPLELPELGDECTLRVLSLAESQQYRRAVKRKLFLAECLLWLFHVSMTAFLVIIVYAFSQINQAALVFSAIVFGTFFAAILMTTVLITSAEKSTQILPHLVAVALFGAFFATYVAYLDATMESSNFRGAIQQAVPESNMSIFSQDVIANPRGLWLVNDSNVDTTRFAAAALSNDVFIAFPVINSSTLLIVNLRTDSAHTNSSGDTLWLQAVTGESWLLWLRLEFLRKYPLVVVDSYVTFSPILGDYQDSLNKAERLRIAFITLVSVGGFVVCMGVASAAWQMMKQ